MDPGMTTMREDAPTRAGFGSTLVVLALVIAFSPVLLDLAAHLADAPWARAALAAPLLAWLAAGVDRPERAPAHGRRFAIAAFAAALVLQFVAIGGDAIRIARVGVAVAVAVACWGSGLARWRASLLVLAVLPVPSLVLDLVSPQLESLLGRAVSLLPGIGFAVADGTPRLLTAQAPIVLDPLDGGLALAIGFAVLAWTRAVLVDASVGVAVRRVLLAVVSAFPVQLGLLGLAAGPVAALAGEGIARGVLDHASWVVVLAAAIALAVHHRGSARPMPDAHVSRGDAC